MESDNWWAEISKAPVTKKTPAGTNGRDRRSSTEKKPSPSRYPKYERQYRFWEDLTRVAKENHFDPWQQLGPRNSNDLRWRELPDVLVSWTIRVRSQDSYCNLWIDLGDPATNRLVLDDLQRRTDTSGLDFEVTWDLKETDRGCSVDAEPVACCGYATDPATRAPRLLNLLERDRQLRAAVQPHVAAAAAPYL